MAETIILTVQIKMHGRVSFGNEQIITVLL